MDQTFIADSMLGKLARWLRIIGCDTEYFTSIDDAALVDRAFSSGRLILTRDTLLVLRRKARGNHFLVEGDHFRDQFRQVVAAFHLDPFARFLTRCLECNDLLFPSDRTAIFDRVPPYVFQTQEQFRTCPSCHRVYWAGTQRDRMVREVSETLGVAAPDRS